jgi:signal transduction histidine kinase
VKGNDMAKQPLESVLSNLAIAKADVKNDRRQVELIEKELERAKKELQQSIECVGRIKDDIRKRLDL